MNCLQGFHVFTVCLQWWRFWSFGFSHCLSCSWPHNGMQKPQGQRRGENRGSGMIQAHIRILSPNPSGVALGKVPYYNHWNENIVLITRDWSSLVAHRVRNLPATQETWVRSLGREDTLEKGMATYSSILAWRISWTEEPGELHSVAELDMTEWLTRTLETCRN